MGVVAPPPLPLPAALFFSVPSPKNFFFVTPLPLPLPPFLLSSSSSSSRNLLSFASSDSFMTEAGEDAGEEVEGRPKNDCTASTDHPFCLPPFFTDACLCPPGVVSSSFLSTAPRPPHLSGMASCFFCVGSPFFASLHRRDSGSSC